MTSRERVPTALNHEEPDRVKGLAEEVRRLHENTPHALLRQITDMMVDRAMTYLQAVGPFIDLVTASDDLGMQSDPFLSPAMYRALIKPYHAELSGIKYAVSVLGIGSGAVVSPLEPAGAKQKAAIEAMIRKDQR